MYPASPQLVPQLHMNTEQTFNETENQRQVQPYQNNTKTSTVLFYFIFFVLFNWASFPAFLQILLGHLIEQEFL